MPAVLRRMAAILVLLATGVLLLGCGRGGHSAAAGARATTGTRSGPNAAPPASGARPGAKALALAYARAVNLTAADVPGFRRSPESRERETASGEQVERAMVRCVGGRAGGRGLAELSSSNFERQTATLSASVSSQVSVARTPALASSELAQIRSPRARGCLERYLDLLFKGRQYHGAFSAVSVATGTPPAPGATGSFGWRISSTITVHGIRVPLYLDILGFVDGPAEVSLMSSGLPRPFPAAAEQQLFLLLLKRAESRSA